MDIIIGGGMTGLAFARFDKGHDYTILEKDSTLGGYSRTTLRNGFVWDYSGHFFHFQDPEIEAMIAAHMRAEDILNISKVTHIKYKDRLVDFPFQKNIHQLDKEELIDCLYDLFTAPTGEYHNFQEMLYCKFGKSIAEKFLVPYNAKLYACDLNTLDKDAMGRFFPYAEKEDIVRNFRHSHNDSYNGSFVYPKGGAIQYVNSIASGIPQECIRKNSEVHGINPKAHTVTLKDGTTLHYDRLVSSMPFPLLMKATGLPHNADVFTWNQVLVFNLGFESKGPNTIDNWIYFPEGKYCFYRVGFYDNILGQNRTSLYVELGFSKGDIVHPEGWKQRVLDDLVAAGVTDPRQKLVDCETIIMNPAYVHINQKSMDEVEKQKEVLAGYDIYSIGRYGSWTYCSIEDNIKEARALAAWLH